MNQKIREYAQKKKVKLCKLPIKWEYTTQSFQKNYGMSCLRGKPG